MEFMLQTVVVIFMLFLCALCLFAVVVIARDIVHESVMSKRERDAQKNSEKKEPVQVIVQPVVEEKPASVVDEEVTLATSTEEVAVAEERDGPDGVVFSKVALTMAEKYQMLSSEHKRYFDQIVKHALSKEGVTEAKRNSAYDYKIGTYRVVRIMIKRGEIVCEFNFIDRDLQNYASEASVKVNHPGTTVKVSEKLAVGVVKDGIDLVVTQIAEDKEHKKMLAREKRNEKRRQERAKKATSA
jgi:heme exporter protein D